MKSWEKAILRLALLGTLYVLASPVYLVLGASPEGRLRGEEGRSKGPGPIPRCNPAAL
jgi:hypothetical protein